MDRDKNWRKGYKLRKKNEQEIEKEVAASESQQK